MPIKDKRIDAYIAKSKPFAQPILKRMREQVHSACPDVTETVKWGFPHFEYKGSILCSMAAFKEHCVFGWWLGPVMNDKNKVLTKTGETAMGHLGRITSLKDLPSDKIMIAYHREAAELIDKGVKNPAREKKTEKKELEIPAYFTRALGKNKKALKTFKGFSYSNKKDYLEWVTEAKSEETRNKRLETAVEWMAEGKIRNWKYARK